MDRISIGTISEGYEAFVIRKGFDIAYEIVEDEEISNTYETLEDFAENVMMIINPMGFYSVRRVASELFKRIDDKETVAKEIGLNEEQMDWLNI